MIVKYLLFILAFLAIPWAIRTWWQMRRTRGPRERAFIKRTSLSTWMLLALAAVILGSLRGTALAFAIPVLTVAGLGIRHTWRRTLARIQAEESDPFLRAKRIN